MWNGPETLRNALTKLWEKVGSWTRGALGANFGIRAAVRIIATLVAPLVALAVQNRAKTEPSLLTSTSGWRFSVTSGALFALITDTTE